jgi:hypothetical protein
LLKVALKHQKSIKSNHDKMVSVSWKSKRKDKEYWELIFL